MALNVAMQGGRTLDSWKEIAAYLDRGIRTVQRWERELGLPVHRLEGKKRGAILAYPAELDAWVEAHSSQLRQNDETRPNWALRLALASAALVTLLGATALATRQGWFRGQPHSVVVHSSELRVLDDHGRELWNHTFNFPLVEAIYTAGANTHPPRRYSFVSDLDGDGEVEVLFIPYAPAASDLPRRELICFDSRGRVRWRYQPARPVHFGDETFEPPFPVDAFFLPDFPNQPPGHLWLVSHHARWFPAVVTKLDFNGQVLAEFWHGGHVEVLKEAELDRRRVLLVGATNNEQTSAALAVLDAGNPEGSSPAVSPNYQCLDCPAGEPLLYLVFPRTALSRAVASRPTIYEIWAKRNGQVELAVNEAKANPPAAAGPSCSFDSQFRLQSAGLVDPYLSLHAELQKQGLLKQPLDRQREEKRLHNIRYWNGREFVPYAGYVEALAARR